MKLLLNTHALLWYTHDDPRLSSAAEALILGVLAVSVQNLL